MKRLIVVIISILFLTVFLMMNYLLWDKDNLLKQQESDKVQQDWLRGQNKDMEANMAELKQAAAVLEKDKAALNEQNNSLQRQIRAATDRETSLRRTLDERILSVEALKTSSLPILKDLLAGWMTAVSEGRSADSFLFFSRDFNFLQRVMTQETYQQYIETYLQALSFQPAAVQQPAGDAAPTDAAPGDAAPTDAAPTDAAPTDAAPGDAKAGDAKATGLTTEAGATGSKTSGAMATDGSTADQKASDLKTTDLKTAGVKTSEGKPAEAKPAVVTPTPTPTPEPVILFERIGNEAADLEVLVRTQVYATLKPDGNTGIPGFAEGLNTVQVLFVYDVINQKWYIQSIYGN